MTERTAFLVVRRQRGVTLIEMMISMVIGLVILGGVIAVFAGSRVAFDTAQSQNLMMEDARYALHMLAQDIRLSGSFGPNNQPETIDNRTRSATPVPNLLSDCAPGWFADVEIKLFGADNTNPYNTTCLGAAVGYQPQTDLLAVRFATPIEVPDAVAVGNTYYVKSLPGRGEIWNGSNAAPDWTADGNYQLQSALYYVSDFTNAPGDQYPSLHRITLTSGPQLSDQLVAPGVEDFQVQFGIDDCQPDCDGSINYYVDASNGVLNWNDAATVDRIMAVRVWMLVRAQNPEAGLRNNQTYNLGSRVVTVNDDYRRLLISNVFRIRNQANR